MIIDFKNPRIYGDLKKDSRYSTITSIPWPLEMLIPGKCKLCSEKAEYQGEVRDTKELVQLCFDDMLKELDLKPNADELIKTLRG